MSPVKSERQRIGPDWTLGQLKDHFPGVELAMFAHFGVGSRERSGFSASENLANLLRRHLIFDAERACARLDELAEEDWSYELEVTEFADGPQRSHTVLLDVRSLAEHQLCAPNGARYLNATVIQELRTQNPDRVVAICNDGSQAPAASRHLRSLGLKAYHARGGVVAWSRFVDPDFPILYPLVEIQDRWHLLADGNTLRFRSHTLKAQLWRLWTAEDLKRHPLLKVIPEQVPELTLLAVSPRSFSARGPFEHLEPVIAHLRPWLTKDAPWSDGGGVTTLTQEKETIAACLAEDAPKILKDHKGTVEIASYEDRVLTLRLGGGCAGCASSSVTTQRELAAELYRRVPLLDTILSEE